MKPNTSKLMQTLLRTGGICGAVAAVGTVGVTVSTDAQAQISGTKHNLSVSGTGTVKSSGTEICAFCHTPHASNTAALGAPLWNKAVPASTGFSVYTSSTLDSSVNAGPGQNSLACLSCHDGVGAMDNMINKPGAGGLNTAGASAGYTWTGAPGGTMPAGSIANISRDLRNDHPIGIEYAGGGYTRGTSVTPAGGKVTCNACTDKDFWEPTGVAGSQTWYLNINVTAGRQKEDPTLYANATDGRIYVECGSCHDPHVAPKIAGEIAFLRIQSTGSAICLACHNK